MTTPTRDEAAPLGYMRPADKDGNSFWCSRQKSVYYTDPVFASAPAPASGGVDEVANGWLFTNPGSGVEWSEQHPIESGEVPDAQDLRPATLGNLLFELTCAWTVLASLSPAATPVFEAETVTMTRQQIDGLLRAAYPLATASERAGALEAAIAKPASSPAGGDVALRALYEWYDRDGSVGAASEVFEKHRAALSQSAATMNEKSEE